jgi:aryl-alcohol dehydrogenase-like predicted oxidoreductase
MKYTTLGDSGLEVSRICLGTMTYGEQNSESEAHEQIDYALAQGVNFIDTAELYPVPPKAETQGRTEQYVGTWLQSRHLRDKVILATKVVGPGDWVDYFRDGRPRLDRTNIERALDASLSRLHTDYVDLYQLHWPDRSTNFFGKLGYESSSDDKDTVPIEETLDALNELVRAGKIRAVGISNETPWGMMRYLELARWHRLPNIVSVQNPYNLLNRTFEVGLAEIAHREKVGLLAYSPLAFGVLSGKYLKGTKPGGSRLALFSRFDRYSNPQAEAAAAEYVALARDHGLDPAQMALAYVNSRPFLTSTIIGATGMDQLKANIASIDLELSAEVLEGIEAIHTRQPSPAP